MSNRSIRVTFDFLSRLFERQDAILRGVFRRSATEPRHCICTQTSRGLSAIAEFLDNVGGARSKKVSSILFQPARKKLKEIESYCKPMLPMECVYTPKGCFLGVQPTRCQQSLKRNSKPETVDGTRTHEGCLLGVQPTRCQQSLTRNPKPETADGTRTHDGCLFGVQPTRCQQSLTKNPKSETILVFRKFTSSISYPTWKLFLYPNKMGELSSENSLHGRFQDKQKRM